MYYNLNAIILAREAVRDDDLLVTVYSKERGKLRLQARGAKKIKSKLAGHLEPVSLSYLNATMGKRADQLIGAQSNNSYKNIKSNLAATETALWCLNFLAGQTFENERDEPIFNLTSKTLDYLEKLVFVDQAVIASEFTNERRDPVESARLYPFPLNDNYFFNLIKVAFGYKLLYLLGHDPSASPDFELKNEIIFLHKNKINEILKNGKIINNINQLLEQINKKKGIE